MSYEIDNINDLLANEYGNISADGYLALVNKRDLLIQKKLPYEFREDYEIFMQKNGELYIRYGGSCSVCGYSKEFSLGKFMGEAR